MEKNLLYSTAINQDIAAHKQTFIKFSFKGEKNENNYNSFYDSLPD